MKSIYMLIRFFLGGVFLIFWNSSVMAAQSENNRCFKIGETATVIGQAIQSVNGETYFQLLKPLCVYEPAPKTKNEDHLSILGKNKLQPNRYLKITGVLYDAHERGAVGVNIDVKRAIDVNEEVMAEKEEVKQSCEKWQNENSSALKEKTHGARGVPAYFDSGKSKCGIWAVDNEEPHKTLYLWRPDPM
jgi:hypothetical protein